MSAPKLRQVPLVESGSLYNVRVDNTKVRFRSHHQPEIACTIESNQIVQIGKWALDVNSLIPINDDYLFRCCKKYEHLMGSATNCVPEHYQEALFGLEIALIRESEAMAKSLDRAINTGRVYSANTTTPGTRARLESARREMVRTIIKNTNDLAAIINLANIAYRDYTSGNPKMRESAIGLANVIQLILFHFVRSVNYEYSCLSTNAPNKVDVNGKSMLNTISWIKLDDTVQGTKRDFADSNEDVWIRISIPLRYIIVAGQLQKSLVIADLSVLTALSKSPSVEGLAVFRVAYHTGLYDVLVTWDRQIQRLAEAEEQRYRQSSARDRPSRRERQDMNEIISDDQYRRPNTRAPPLQNNKDSRGRGRRADFEDSYGNSAAEMQHIKRRQQRPTSEGPASRNRRQEHYRDGNNYDNPIDTRDPVRRRMSSRFERPAKIDPDDPDRAQQQKRRPSRKPDETGPSKEDQEKDKGMSKTTAFLNRLVEKYLI